MKKQLLVPILTASILVVMALVSAYAQSNSWIRADIPFNFTAGSGVAPAGHYFLSVQQGVYRIRNTESGSTFLGSVTGPGLGAPGRSAPYLLFHRYGEQYFLATISMSGSDCSTLPKSNQEREAAIGNANSVAGKGVMKPDPVYLAAR